MAIKQRASCIDTAIHTTLLTLCRLEREFFLYLFYLYFGGVLLVLNSKFPISNLLVRKFHGQGFAEGKTFAVTFKVTWNREKGVLVYEV